MRDNAPKQKVFRPWSLQLYFLVPFGLIALLSAFLLIGLLDYVTKKGGIVLHSTSPYYHFIWTIPPVVFATAITLLLGAVVFKIERLMPWFSMSPLIREAPGNDKSTHLDYLDNLAPLIPIKALRNKHWVVAVCSGISLIAAALSSSIAPLLFLNPVDSVAVFNVVSSANPGLIDGYQYLENFYKAAISMSSAVSYTALGYPLPTAWISPDGWSVGHFTMNSTANPFSNATSMTFTASAIQVDPGCESAAVTYALGAHTDTDAMFDFHAVGKVTGCAYDMYNFSLVTNQCAPDCWENWGVNVTPCNRKRPDGTDLDPSQWSLVYWTGRMLSGNPQSIPLISVTMCTPTLTLWQNATVTMDVKTNDILSVKTPTSGPPNPPLQIDPMFNGSAFNGYNLVYFNNWDGILADRRSTIQNIVSSSIYFAAKGSPTSVYNNNTLTQVVSNVYRTYLSIISREVYFTQETENYASTSNGGQVQVHFPENHLFVNKVSAYLSSLILVLIAVGLWTTAGYMYIWRGSSIPKHEGTIATAALATKDLPLEALRPNSGYFFYTYFASDPSSPQILSERAPGSHEPVTNNSG